MHCTYVTEGGGGSRILIEAVKYVHRDYRVVANRFGKVSSGRGIRSAQVDPVIITYMGALLQSACGNACV